MEKVGISLGIFEGQASTPLAVSHRESYLWLRFPKQKETGGLQCNFSSARDACVYVWVFGVIWFS